MFLKLLNKICALNDFILSPVTFLIDKLSWADWIKDALTDSFNILPFLLFIFILIELFEFYFMDRLHKVVERSKKFGPVIGGFAALIPQCGFSVIASSLYVRRLISRGTLLAVYLATSDEAIPVLMSEPDKAYLIVPILGVKFFIGITAGYLVDFFVKSSPVRTEPHQEHEEILEHEHGCCSHSITRQSNIFLHPVLHTLHVFAFILLITLALNYIVFMMGGEEQLGHYFLTSTIWQPVIAAFIGLIPNCAVSVAITLLYMKGLFSFASVVSGLLSGAGLGLLVLFRKNGIKDTATTVGLLLGISIFSGIAIQILQNIF